MGYYRKNKRGISHIVVFIVFMSFIIIIGSIGSVAFKSKKRNYYSKTNESDINNHHYLNDSMRGYHKNDCDNENCNCEHSDYVENCDCGEENHYENETSGYNVSDDSWNDSSSDSWGENNSSGWSDSSFDSGSDWSGNDSGSDW